MSFLYLVTIGVLLLSYVGVLFMFSFFKKKTLTNVILISIIFVCYILNVVIAYVKNGPLDWNFTNTLPTANVSPFMFAVSPLYLVLPKKIKKYFGSLIAILPLGMILSPLISCVYFFFIGYTFHIYFCLDYISHIAFAIIGVYLVYSKQVELKFKNALIGAGIIYVVAIVMVILNLIFDTSFFGLSLMGKHNIYNQVFVDSSVINAYLYFIGLTLVLVLGFFFNKLLQILLGLRKKTSTQVE